MDLLKSINEVSRLHIEDNNLIVTYKKSLKKLSNDINVEWVLELLGGITNINLFKSQIITEYLSPETGFEIGCILNIENPSNIEKKIFNVMIRSISKTGYALGMKYNLDYSDNKILIDFNNVDIIWEKPLKYLPFFYNNDLLLSAVNSSIVRYDINGEEMWFFDTIELGTWIDYDKSEKQTEVSKVIGILNEKIYFYLNSGLILVLATETGDMIQTIVNDKNKDQGSFNGWFMGAIELDVRNSKLIQLFNQRYTEVDLNTNEVIEILLPQMVEQKLMNFNAFVFDDEYIYFSDQSECKIVAFNRASHLLEWVHPLSDPNTCEIDGSRFGRSLQLHNRRLYVLDNKQTLHVFEKENKAINS